MIIPPPPTTPEGSGGPLDDLAVEVTVLFNGDSFVVFRIGFGLERGSTSNEGFELLMPWFWSVDDFLLGVSMVWAGAVSSFIELRVSGAEVASGSI